MSRTRCPRCGATVGPFGVDGRHWHGEGQLDGLLVPLEEVRRWPGNPRQGDVGAISESLRRFGQTKPIVVQESSAQIAAGNHLYDAMTALGWTHAAMNVVPMDDREAAAYLIADNRTAELGSYDEAALGDFLKGLAQEGNLRGTGYDGDDVDAFLKGLESEAPKIQGELAFSGELLEEHNYVVLVFRNSLDWNMAQTKLGLETVRAPDATETYDRRGIGRILDGVAVLNRIPG